MRATHGPPADVIAKLRSAREIARLGARPLTISLLTGLDPAEVLRVAYDEAFPSPKGPPRYAEERYFRVNYRVQAELSAFAARALQLIKGGTPFGAAAVATYRNYLATVKPASIAFDDAFYLLSQLTGSHACTHQSLELRQCPECTYFHIVPLGDTGTHRCALCRLSTSNSTTSTGAVLRPSTSARSQREADAVTNVASRQNDTAEADLHIQALTIQAALQAFGASPAVSKAVLSGIPTPRFLRSPRVPTKPVFNTSRLPLTNWTKLGPSLRAQLTVVCSSYLRLSNHNIDPVSALLESYRHLVTLMASQVGLLQFDKAFEAISHLSASWGIEQADLGMAECSICGASHVVSLRDPADQSCPFCLLADSPSNSD